MDQSGIWSQEISNSNEDKTLKTSAICLAAILFVSPVSTLNAADPADEYRQAVLAAQKQCRDAIAEARAKYVMALTEALTAETQKGDLDAAIAIRDQIKALQNQPVETDIVMDRLAGSDWINTNSIPFQWKEDGSYYWNGKPGICIQIDSKRLAIVFQNFRVGVLVFNDDFTTFEQWGHEDRDKPLFTGKRVSLKR